MYDNSGILRANIPTDGYVGRNVQIIYDSLVVQSSKNCLVRINRLGQVTHSYPVYGYHSKENMHTMAVPEYTCWQQLIVKI